MPDQPTPPAPAPDPTPAPIVRPEGPTVLMQRKSDTALAWVDNTDEAVAQWEGYGFEVASDKVIATERKAMAARELIAAREAAAKPKPA